MTIRLNGADIVVEARTLADVVVQCGFGSGKIATAVNGRFVAACDRASTVLGTGDKVEIVSPRQGG